MTLEPRRQLHSELRSPRQDDSIGAILAEVSWVEGLARRLARDASSGDDLSQAALVLALEKRPSPDGGLRPWFARVLPRLARHRRRADARRAGREERAVRGRDRVDTSVDELLLRLEAQELIAGAVRRLGDPYREVIVRHYYAGQSLEAIAEATRRPAPTVRSQLRRALSKLRAHFDAPSSREEHRFSSALALFVCAGNGTTPTPALVGAGVGVTTFGTAAALLLLVAGGWFVGTGLLSSPSDRPSAAMPSSLSETSANPAVDDPVESQAGRRLEGRDARGTLPTADAAATDSAAAEPATAESTTRGTSGGADLVFRGLVVHADGRAADGAVVLTALESEDGLGQLARAGGPRPDDRRVRMVTDVRGRFEGRGLPAGARLWVQGDGSYWTLTDPIARSSRSRSGVPIELDPIVLEEAPHDRQIRGVVRGLVRGERAVVFAESLAHEVNREVSTDPEGSFALVPRTHRPIALVATCTSATEETLSSRVVIAQSGEQIELTLDSRAELSVSVVDENGRPVADARLGLSLGAAQLPPIGGGPQRVPGSREVRTDARGRATVHPPAGSFALEVRAEGAATRRLEFDSAPEEGAPLLVRLDRVASGAESEPIADAMTDRDGIDDPETGPGSAALSVELAGVLRIDGRPARDWDIAIRSREDSKWTPIQTWTRANGGFDATLPPGWYDVECRGFLESGDPITVIRETQIPQRREWRCDLETSWVELDLANPHSVLRAVRGDPANGGREIVELGPAPAGRLRVCLPRGTIVIQSRESESADSLWRFVDEVQVSRSH